MYYFANTLYQPPPSQTNMVESSFVTYYTINFFFYRLSCTFKLAIYTCHAFTVNENITLASLKV